MLDIKGLYFKPDDPPAGDPPEDPKSPPDDPPSDKLPKSWEEVFNHPRFKQLNQRAKDAEDELATLKANAKKKQEDELKEQQKWEDLYNGSQKELEAERNRNLRFKVGLDSGLPAEIIDRLQGENEEEMKADADRLAAIIKTDVKPKGVPPKDKNSQPVEIGSSPAEIRKNKSAILQNAQSYVRQ